MSDDAADLQPLNPPGPNAFGCGSSGYTVINLLGLLIDFLFWLLVTNLLVWIFRQIRSTALKT